MWVFPSKAIEMFGGRGTQHLAAQLAQKGPVTTQVSGEVGRIQKDSPLVLRFLAKVQLYVPVQQLDGRVEMVTDAALVFLRDESSHNNGERALVWGGGGGRVIKFNSKM